jgi:ketosteroid isomerase-like protein
LIAVTTFPVQEQPVPARLASLVQAERAFARASVERGIRDSFLAFFAEDGINFKPEPANARKSLVDSPPLSSASKTLLHWEPVNADISEARDLGYTTGPFVLTVDGTVRRNGYYFSIWKRQKDGGWKVALDYGIQTPAPKDEAARPQFSAAREVKRSAAPGTDSSSGHAKNLESLLASEKEFSRGCRTDGAAKHYSTFLDPDARLHRGGVFPIVGREKIVSMLTRAQVSVGWEPSGGDVARSGDLGYSYGSYEATHGGQASPVEKGYYARVWRKDERGEWKVVADISNTVGKN